jgi:uncharacterized protein YciI
MQHSFISILIAAALFFPGAVNAETPAPAIYDAALAEELGADEYGMRPYIFVMLRTGPADAEVTDKDQRSEMFRGHFANMVNLAEEGKLMLAGPLSNGTNERGLFILNVASVEEAQTLMQDDPTIAAGIFTAEYLNYYGSAALMKLNEIHASIQKISIE